MCEIFGRLYVKILDVFTWIFDRLSKHSTSTAMKALSQQKTFVTSLQDMLDRVKAEAAKLNDEAIFAISDMCMNLSNMRVEDHDNRKWA